MFKITLQQSLLTQSSDNSAMIQCQICMEDFKCAVNYLSEPVDVYSEWIDACEEANKEEG